MTKKTNKEKRREQVKKMITENKKKMFRCLARGIVPSQPRVFWDYDLADGEDRGTAIGILRDFVRSETAALMYCHCETPNYTMWGYGIYACDKCNKELPPKNRDEIYPKLPYAIYETKYGYHLIIKYECWDNVQAALYKLYELTKKQSIMSCRKQRIRVSPKLLKENAQIVSPAPRLVETNISEELRVGKEEIYETYDRSDVPNISEEIYEKIGEKKE